MLALVCGAVEMIASQHIGGAIWLKQCVTRQLMAQSVMGDWFGETCQERGNSKSTLSIKSWWIIPERRLFGGKTRCGLQQVFTSKTARPESFSMGTSVLSERVFSSVGNRTEQNKNCEQNKTLDTHHVTDWCSLPMISKRYWVWLGYDCQWAKKPFEWCGRTSITGSIASWLIVICLLIGQDDTVVMRYCLWNKLVIYPNS